MRLHARFLLSLVCMQVASPPPSNIPKGEMQIKAGIVLKYVHDDGISHRLLQRSHDWHLIGPGRPPTAITGASRSGEHAV